MCKACNAHNYASKTACHKCSAGKDGEKWNAEATKPDNFRAGDWMCPCGAHNYASKNMCHKCGTNKMVASLASTAGDNFRPGDWMCPCSAHNYATKVACHKCGMAKGMAMGMGFGGMMGGGAPPMMAQMGGGAGMPGNFRPGDWLCSCGAHNYASKNACHKCSTPKQQAQAGGQQQQYGAQAGQQQYGQQDMYNSYGMGQMGQYGDGMNMGGMGGFGGFGGAMAGPAMGMMGGAASTPANFRPGDWLCQCGAHNYASKTACHKCASPKQSSDSGVGAGVAAPTGGAGGMPNNFRPGDWMCQCSAHNYASKTACHKCGTAKPDGM